MDDYKTLCTVKKEPKKSYKRGKTKKGARSGSPDWVLLDKREKRIMAKKETEIDFCINDKFIDKLNKTLY